MTGGWPGYASDAIYTMQDSATLTFTYQYTPAVPEPELGAVLLIIPLLLMRRRVKTV